MDAHTLDILEFPKLRDILAGYTASSLGRELALAIAPSHDIQALRLEIRLVSEMVDALNSGQSPPFSGLHDVRLVVRR
ncbi:MAG: endonuclease MutS2, partial [Gemmataceae bacterium]